MIFCGWIAFTFFSANVSQRFGGKLFADFNEGIVEVGSDIIPGFSNLAELGYLNWLIPRVIKGKYESPNHKKIFNMMVRLNNNKYKSKNIKEIMADLNLEDFNDLNSLTKEIPYEFTNTKHNKNIKGVIETLKSHQKNRDDKVLTLTCSDKNTVYNFVFMDNKAILTKSINYRKIGFHGQTIFHNSEERISKQLGLGEQLSYITKKTVIYNFRQNDLKNGGEGAPLTPVYHQLLVKTFEDSKKLKLPVTILNIGGIANITTFDKENEMTSMDIGPGNCLIDKWVRLNSNKEFDENGYIAKSGKIDKIILEQALDNFYHNNISKKRSLDTNDFDISFVRGLSLENGAATLTEMTAEILSKKILDNDTYVCGGGRKNKFLINLIQKKIQHKIREIDYLGIDGGFIESQAFGYLAIRSYLGLPISFPETTGCKESSTGGLIVKNF